MRAVNLLPKDAERARRAAPDPALLVGVAGFAVVVAALLSMYMSASQKVQNKKNDYGAKQAQLAQIMRVNRTVSPAQIAVAGPEADRIGAVASALSYRVPWDYILGRIAMAVPSGVKLTSLTVTTPTSANPTFAATTTGTTTNQLSLGGWTYSQESVALLMSRLNVLPPLGDVILVSSTVNSGTKPETYQFSISATIRAPGGSS
jgi:Tfp pilus assembly protein PilN